MAAESKAAASEVVRSLVRWSVTLMLSALWASVSLVFLPSAVEPQPVALALAIGLASPLVLRFAETIGAYRIVLLGAFFGGLALFLRFLVTPDPHSPWNFIWTLALPLVVAYDLPRLWFYGHIRRLGIAVGIVVAVLTALGGLGSLRAGAARAAPDSLPQRLASEFDEISDWNCSEIFGAEHPLYEGRDLFCRWIRFEGASEFQQSSDAAIREQARRYRPSGEWGISDDYISRRYHGPDDEDLLVELFLASDSSVRGKAILVISRPLEAER